MRIGDILSMNAYRFPAKIALIAKEGNISYRQLEETANQIANILEEPRQIHQLMRDFIKETGYVQYPY